MDCKPPKISISTITYNHASYLDEFFISVFDQDYENLEVVIADDCSTDKTQEILLKYKQLYPEKIKLIFNKKNIGITKNSQNAIQQCTGKYICTIAGDDLLMPGKLKKQVEVMEDNPELNMTFHDLEVFYEDGTSSILFSEMIKSFPRQGSMAEMIRYGSFAGACSIMLRREAIPAWGFDQRLSIASDWLFFVETVGNGRFLYIDEVMGKYRRHSNNITSKKAISAFDDHIFSCAILLSRYPRYHDEIIHRMAVVLYEKSVQQMRVGDESFMETLKASLETKITGKALFLNILRKFGFDNYDELMKIKNKFQKSMKL